jgi:hypothetical protein
MEMIGSFPKALVVIFRVYCLLQTPIFSLLLSASFKLDRIELSAERLGRSSPLASIKVENLHGKFGI